MFDVSEDMARYVPSFQYEVHDLGSIPMERLSRDPEVMAGLALLKFVKHRFDMTVEHLTEILRALSFDTNFAGIVFHYFVARYEWTQPEFAAALDGIEDEGGKAIMGTLVETWVKQGKAEGEAKSLVRLLVKRFGSLPQPVVAQIAAGSIKELDRWFDAAITASSVEAVFGERRDH